MTSNSPSVPYFVHAGLGGPAAQGQDCRPPNTFARACAGLGILAGLLALFSWLVGFRLPTELPHLMSDRPFVAAASAFAIGLCLWTMVESTSIVATALAIAVALVVVAANAAALAAGYLLGPLAVAGVGELDPVRGRALMSHASLAILALACASVDARWARRIAVPQILGLGVAALSAHSLLDVLFTRVLAQDRLLLTPLSPNFAAILGLLGLAIAFARPSQAIGSVVFAKSESGTLIRRLLAGSLTVPFLIGLASLYGQKTQLFSIGASAAFLTVSATGILIALVIVTGLAHGRTDSARRTAEAELKKTQERLHGILENAGAVIFVKDLSGRYRLANRRYLDLFQLATEDVIGKTDRELFPEEIAEPFIRNDRAVIASLQPIQAEETAVVHGEERTFLTVRFPLSDELGRPYAVGGIATDITDLKRAEAAAQMAREEAERASRAKTEFLSRMSHELRTPLNAVLGFAQLLQLHDPTDRQREAVDLISQAGKHLLSLIDEILDIAKIEAGLLITDLRPTPIGRAVEDALLLVEPAAKRNGNHIAVIREPLGKSCVLADEKRLRQILTNLLANAVKYAGQGAQITITLKESPAGTLQMSVADTGPGIPPDKRHLLFQPFERLGAEGEGSGLGLALCKGMVEAMQGRIYYDEQRSKGAAFVVELPLCDPDATPPPAHPFKDIPARELAPVARRVLYIEDNEANVNLMKQILAARPFVEVEVSDEGAKGLELATSKDFDLVLLDLNLPDTTGDKVLEELRRNPKTAQVPVVVVTADVAPQTRERCEALGATEFITKPFEIGKVLATLDRLLLSGG